MRTDVDTSRLVANRWGNTVLAGRDGPRAIPVLRDVVFGGLNRLLVERGSGGTQGRGVHSGASGWASSGGVQLIDQVSQIGLIDAREDVRAAPIEIVGIRLEYMLLDIEDGSWMHAELTQPQT